MALKYALKSVDWLQKFTTMLTKEDLIETFRNAIDIIPFNSREDNSVFLGFVSITDAVGLDAILERYTSYIDDLIAKLPLTHLQYLELISARAFTYEEYKTLWQIKARDISRSMICKVLLITTEEELRLFTSVAKDDSHESFMEFLKTYTDNANQFLHNLIYESYS